jgi:uncharacterized protein YraI
VHPIVRRLRAVAFLLLAIPVCVLAQQAYTTRGVSMRAGPSTQYPKVGRLGGGAPVTLIGCLGDWSWCDVIYANLRGWVYAPYLSYLYRGGPVPLYTYAPSLGIPIIGFSIGPYWDRYYRGRPWYGRRDYWISRPPPHVRPPGPPPRPAPPPPARPQPQPQPRPSPPHAQPYNPGGGGAPPPSAPVTRAPQPQTQPPPAPVAPAPPMRGTPQAAPVTPPARQTATPTASPAPPATPAPPTRQTLQPATAPAPAAPAAPTRQTPPPAAAPPPAPAASPAPAAGSEPGAAPSR